jgi:hypothetical protein
LFISVCAATLAGFQPWNFCSAGRTGQRLGSSLPAGSLSGRPTRAFRKTYAAGVDAVTGLQDPKSNGVAANDDAETGLRVAK